MRTLYSFDIKLTIRAPFLFEGLLDSAFGVGAAAIRNHNGQAIIPRSHIRGHLADALRMLGDAGVEPSLTHELVEDLIGKPSEREDGEHSNRPQRGCMMCEDFVLNLSPHGGDGCTDLAFPTRVAISEDTGAAQVGALVAVEAVAPPGQECVFQGRVHLEPQVEGLGSETLTRVLKLAFLSVDAMGAQKSVGFGQVVGVSLEKLGSSPISPLDQKWQDSANDAFIEGYRQLAYGLTFNQPLLVDVQMIADNAVRGSKNISGATIKGALAARLEAAGDVQGWQEVLAQLIFLPAKPDCDPQELLRTRTAVDSRAFSALEGKLFSQTEIAETTEEGELIQWRGLVVWSSALEGSEALNTILDLFCKGIFPVGQTKAIGAVTLLDDEVPDSGDLLKAGEALSVTALQTTVKIELTTRAHLLTDQRQADGADIRAQLLAYFQDVLGEPPESLSFNVAEYYSILGGYHAHRFQVHGPATYAPMLVFEPGASFTLTLSASALGKLRGYALVGLPVGKIGGKALGWEQTPFVPENGFGRFKVILDEKGGFQ